MNVLTILKDCFNEIKKSLILNGYYTRQIKDGKGIGASFLDWIFISLAIALFFLITIYNSTQSISISLILTGVLIALYLSVLIYGKRKIRNKNILNINEDIGDRQIRKKIEKYKDSDFALYMKEILEKYYDTLFFECDNNIDFIGEINEEIYGIKCIKSSWDNKINLKDVKNYMEEMEKKNILEGIIVTNSYFDEEVKEQTEYLLIDFEHIKHMLKEIEGFPTEEEIEELIISKHKDRRENFKEGFSINRKDKIYKFFLLGLALYIVSSYVAYPSYYKLMAFISFFSGAFIGIYNLLKYIRRIKENRL